MKFELENFCSRMKKENLKVTDCYGLKYSSLRQFLNFYCIPESTFYKWRIKYIKTHGIKAIKYTKKLTQIIISELADLEGMQENLNRAKRAKNGTENNGDGKQKGKL